MTCEELNGRIEDGTINDLIRVAEAKQIKVLSKIADRACEREGIRLVLVAGGSSAGKTTTAKRICTQLKVNDRPAINLSTDDYFVGDKRNPRDENGNLDYEHVECVDIERLGCDINALFKGEAIHERKFNFIEHEPYYSENMLTLPSDGMVVLEGLHALNPRLTEGIDDSSKLRVFVEPKPTLELFAGITPKPEDIRFLRRMVRDNRFRKMDPVATIEMWPKVIAGEGKWITPFKGNADILFDSYLVYELAVLKCYVGGLLERARRKIGNRRLIMNMIRMLNAVVATAPNVVPGDSILRETIGGSQLEY